MDIDGEDQVALSQVQNNIVGLSPVLDYILDYMYHPEKLTGMTLSDWVCCAVKVKIRKGKTQAADDLDDLYTGN
jgi:hypothetical protein